MSRLSSVMVVVLGFSLLAGAGCKSASYAMWEKLGYEKRDLLVSDVKKARDSQDTAAKQFQSTMDRFKEVTNFQGGDLEAKYNKLKADYDKSESRASDVKSRIAKTETVAADMFKEWKGELSQYQDQSLRNASEQKLNATQDRYNQLIAKMKASSAKMDPVLKVFADRVLFLKHNLNASAISSLSGDALKIDSDVQALIKDMQASIKEADDFIGTLK